jgi:hypothetical protein
MNSSLNSQNILQFELTQRPKPMLNKGWSYLLADSLAFQKNIDHAIRIQKPTQEKVPSWIRKLITSGQCKTIYVEDLSLPAHERILIEQLCSQYAVSLVGLTVNDKASNNIVVGPW